LHHFDEAGGGQDGALATPTQQPQPQPSLSKARATPRKRSFTFLCTLTPPTSHPQAEKKAARREKCLAAGAAAVAEARLHCACLLSCSLVALLFLLTRPCCVLAGDPAADPKAASDPVKTLFVARLPHDATEALLRKEFEAFGPVKSVAVVTTPSGAKGRGYAFVEFHSSRDARDAYRLADGRKIGNRRCVVDVERGRLVPGWLPRRLGGGLGGSRNGGKFANVLSSGRAPGAALPPTALQLPPAAHDKDRDRDRERDRDRDRDRDGRHRGSRRSRSRSRERERDRDGSRERRRERERKRRSSRSRSRERSKHHKSGHHRSRSPGGRGDRDKARDKERGGDTAVAADAAVKEEGEI
jgi:RNA recognition motif-containing protein